MPVLKCSLEVVIVGPSGSSKTTPLTCIGCIKDPTNGYIEIDSQVVYDNGWKKADLHRLRHEKIGFVLQTFNLIPFLTTLANVFISMDLVGKRDHKAKDKAIELLDYLQVSDRMKIIPRTSLVEKNSG